MAIVRMIEMMKMMKTNGSREGIGREVNRDEAGQKGETRIGGNC